MAAPALERLNATDSADSIRQVLERDGAAIIEDIVTTDQLRRLNNELDDLIRVTLPGLRHPSHDFAVDFYGRKTIRFDGLPARSETFLEFMLLPQLTETAAHFLLPHCEDYLLNTGQLIQIGPEETAQQLHRDEDAWSDLPSPRPQLEIEALFALSDFTADNGATRVVPGSHLWERGRKPEADEITIAEMKAGSAVMYLGSVLHGGGANMTVDQFRRGMFLGYVVGWLRTEENTFLTVPIEKVRDMPRRIQELLGYKPHRGIGVVDVGTPMVLLSSDPSDA